MSIYTSEFFETITQGSVQSAGVVVPLVAESVGPIRSVLDVGCGLGAWTRTWWERRVPDVVGVDGDYVDRTRLLIAGDQFRVRDLTRDFELDRTFDLVMSLEVAEHLPQSAARSFVGALCRHARDAVLFSAAIPCQGGHGHINEQWPSYWASLFEAEGFVPVDAVRPRIWEDGRVQFWYRQNMLLYARGALAEQFDGTPEILDVVHPCQVDHWRQVHRCTVDRREAFLTLLPPPLRRVSASVRHRLTGAPGRRASSGI